MLNWLKRLLGMRKWGGYVRIVKRTSNDGLNVVYLVQRITGGQPSRLYTTSDIKDAIIEAQEVYDSITADKVVAE